MMIKSYKMLSFTLLVALPFLGGVTECTPPEPEPEPEPELCFADDECGRGEYCNTDLCLSPCRDGEACPAVCYGACEPLPEPALCLADSDCGRGEHCNTDACMAPPCGDADGGVGHLTVCYGVCEPDPVVCPALACDLACERFARGPDGCEICECEPPPPVCDAVMCELFCEYGFVTDPTTGCPICECAPPPLCEPVLCDLWCESGFQVDERGCEICACNPSPTETSCGGFAGFACAEGEWCDYPDDAPACGAADHLGTCRPRPEACPEIYGPVCGCDGSTYPNECYANAAGVDVWASGLCAPPEPGR